MKVKALFDMLFTEYPGHVGFAPAVLALTACFAVCAAVLYGAAMLGQAVFADTPTVETRPS